LTKLVVGSAITQAGRRHRQRLPVSVAANLAIETLAGPGLPARVHQLAEDDGVDPPNLIFEIIESPAMADVVAAMKILTRAPKGSKPARRGVLSRSCTAKRRNGI
jgi:EAL domain-containing protein (putative c-di-GMP-specific phosphodiesterase class I)